MRQLRLHLKPWLGLPAAEFTKADLRTMRDKLIDAGTATAANRTARLARAGDALGERRRSDPEQHRAGRQAQRRNKRERVLTKKEIAAIWRACENFGDHEPARNYARMIRFLLVTAQRRDEAASLRHGDILDGTWRQTENKASRPHSLPLPPLALALVGRGDARDYVFGWPARQAGRLFAAERTLDQASGVTIGGCTICGAPRRAACRIVAFATISCRPFSITACPVLPPSICERTRKAEARGVGAWATALTRIVKPALVVA